MDLRQYKKKVLIACSMIEDELNDVFDRFDIQDIEVRWQERGHHNDPDKLRDVVQAEIDRAEAEGAETEAVEEPAAETGEEQTEGAESEAPAEEGGAESTEEQEEVLDNAA